MKKLFWAITLVIFFLVVGASVSRHGGNFASFLHPSIEYALWSFLIGLIVSISLPLGALTGYFFNPSRKITAVCTAFGAGALIAALSLEIIAPTIFEITGKIPSPTQMSHEKKHSIYTLSALLIGCLSGGFLFFALDNLVSTKKRKNKKAGNKSFTQKNSLPALEMERREALPINKENVLHSNNEHGSSPMSLWLGALIDGIPEGFIIGSGFLTLLSQKLTHNGSKPHFSEVLPYTLIVGLFLSNFPEALTATMGMKRKKFPIKKIFFLWVSLVIIISISATLGYFVGAEISHELEIGIEGLAAGAMLTMVAQTMIPEAIHLAGSKTVGLSTLLGYLCTAAFTIL